MIRVNNRQIALAAPAFAAGILFARPPSAPLTVRILVILIWSVLFLRTLCGKRRLWITALIMASVTVFSALSCHMQAQRYLEIQEHLKQTDAILLTGRVCKKEMKNGRYLYYLDHTIRSDLLIPCGTVILYLEKDEIPIGSALKAEGKIKRFVPATNDGQFDMSRFYQARRISCFLFPDRVTVLPGDGDTALFSRVREQLYQFQKKISGIYEAELSPDDAGILSALVLGQRGTMDDALKDMYQDAGIAHILAISGLHLSFLGISLFRLLRKCRLSWVASAGIGTVCMLGFLLMTGMGTAAQRAFLMYVLYVGAQAAGRTYDACIALGIAALVILFRNPLFLYDSGFLFSFSAMCAIVFFVPVFQIGKKENIDPGATGIRKKQKPPPGKKLAVSIVNRFLSALVLQAFLLPVTAWFYYEVPVYALFLNLIVIPLCGGLLAGGLLGGVLGLASPYASKWALVVCHLILNVYKGGIHVTGRIPMGLPVTGRPEPGTVLLYYFCLFFLLFLFRRRKRIARQQILGVLTCMLMGIAILIGPSESFQIAFLDVGQGDGICIMDGQGGHIMIDGGSSSESEVGTYRIEPFLKYYGIGSIDAWIVTHGDLDHYSGALELLESGFPVRRLLLACHMPEGVALSKLLRAARLNHTEVLYVKSGDVLQMADCRMECLYPSGTDRSEETNAMSQVWILRKKGLSVLFTGDIGEEQEELLKDRGLLDSCTVLKVAHHGSNHSSCASFLQTVSPEYAVISVGAGNRYHHPGKQTMERLSACRAEAFLTMERGQISIEEKRGRFRWTFPHKHSGD